MEQALVNDPMLEENDDKHYQFAFDSHVDAYWNNKPGHTKITDLNTMDLFTIVLTPEFNDILTDEGKKQVEDMIKLMVPFYLTHPSTTCQRYSEFKMYFPLICLKLGFKIGCEFEDLKKMIVSDKK